MVTNPCGRAFGEISFSIKMFAVGRFGPWCNQKSRRTLTLVRRSGGGACPHAVAAIFPASGLANPKLRAQLPDLGGTVLPGSAADFGKLIAEETVKWAKVVKFSGGKPD
jgi:hypothetical protein